MKYGIMISSAKKSESFKDAGSARAFFALARETLQDGESVSLYSDSETGTRVTLAHVEQVKTVALADYAWPV